MPQISLEEFERRKQRAIAFHARGRTHYVLHFGLLRFGLPWAVVMGVLGYFGSAGGYPPLVPAAVPRLLAWLLFLLPFGALAGVGWGLWMWPTFDRNVRKLSAPPEPPAV